MEQLMTILREMKSTDYPELQKRAEMDDHFLILPTHVCEKDGKIVGYASVGAVPTVNVWLDSERVKARDTTILLSQLEGYLDKYGIKSYFMPCASSSPLFGFMAKLGFKNIMATNLFIKKRS